MNFIKRLWNREPALVITTLVAVIVGAAGQLGIVLDDQSVAEVVSQTLFILLGGATIRSKVTPTK